jgi:hypothetical protein
MTTRARCRLFHNQRQPKARERASIVCYLSRRRRAATAKRLQRGQVASSVGWTYQLPASIPYSVRSARIRTKWVVRLRPYGRHADSPTTSSSRRPHTYSSLRVLLHGHPLSLDLGLELREHALPAQLLILGHCEAHHNRADRRIGSDFLARRRRDDSGHHSDRLRPIADVHLPARRICVVARKRGRNLAETGARPRIPRCRAASQTHLNSRELSRSSRAARGLGRDSKERANHHHKLW